MRRQRDYWRSFLDSLDSNGGHIFILFVLIVVSVRMLKYDWSMVDAKSVLSATLGALLMKFRPSGSNREQALTTTTVAKVTEIPASQD